jgi:hypothetical protein
MASQISPGILLRERDVTTATITGAQALTAAFASSFTKGPVGRITEIDSQRSLIDTFGLPVEANAEDYFVASEFLTYGGRLAVVRAETDGLKTANVGGTDLLVKVDLDWIGNSYANEFAARSPGKWGNSAGVVVIDSGADVYVEFTTAPADASQNPLAVGDSVTFSNGATGYVLSYEASMAESLWKAAIVLDAGAAEPTTSDSLQSDGEDPIDTFTTDAVAEAGRDVGTQTGVAGVTVTGTGAGATFNVEVAGSGTLTVGQAVSAAVGAAVGTTATFNGVVSDTDATFDVVRDVAGAIVSVTPVNGGTGISSGDTIVIAGAQVGGEDITITVADVDLDGGDVTVTLNAAGDDYSDGDTLTLTTVGGTDITVTVVTTAGDTPLTAVYDWWTNTEVSIGTAGNKLNLNALGIRPGTSAFASDRGLLYDEVSVAVVDVDGRISGTVNNVVQTFTSLSKLIHGRSAENGALYYKDIINDESQYLYAGASTVESVIDDGVDGDYVAWGSDSVDLQDDLAAGGTADKFAVLGVYTKQLKYGADDYAYSAGQINAAYDIFATADQTELDFILMGGSINWDSDPETATKLKASKVVAIADARKDCIAFVSPFKGNQIGTGGVSLNAAAQKTNTINFFRSLPSTSYAVFDSGYKQVYDRFNDRFRFIPCNGDVAGLCVNTSQVLADWYSPAGVARGALRNAIKLAYTPSQSDRDDLYTNRINPITVLPGTGVTLFGDKTALASTSAFDRINVRRLFLNLEKRVERLSSGVLFEQNDVLTRSSFASAVNSYLAEVQARRGVTDFLVVCDETNNTPDVIDRNEFVAEIFVKAARFINFVSVTFTATKTGVAFSEVVGRG